MLSLTADSLPVVLLAIANDLEGRDYLRNLPEELRMLRDTLEPEKRGGRWKLELISNATLDELTKALRAHRDRVAIFHYGGHAGPDRLLFESASGLRQAVFADGLSRLLGQQSGLKTVFLNGCSTRAQVDGLLKRGVPSVIATATDIKDSMARVFAESFYAELASGANLRKAFEAAKAFMTAAHGAHPDLFRLDERRDLGTGSREGVSDIEGFPWDLYHRTEADQVLRWNLFLADPMHGLPDLPKDILPPAEPFRRLFRFEREHARVFFGRGRQIRELYDLLVTPKTYPVVLYHGPTGVGKSSILEAGLRPRLERDFCVIALRRDPDRGLLGTLRAGLVSAGQADLDLATAWKGCEDAPPKRPLVVILDQAEEAFTRPHLARPAGVSESEALSKPWIDPERELHELIEALKAVFGPSAQRPLGKLILGFRMEWLQPFEEAFRAATLGFEPMALGPLERAGIVEAIEGPAKAPWLRGRYGLEIASEEGQSPLAEVVAADLEADAGSAVAPTLQVLLGAMWDEAKRLSAARPCFDRPLYERLRKAGILLRDFFDQQCKALVETHPEAAESGFALDLLEYHTTPLGTAEGHSRDVLEKRYPHRTRDLGSVLDRLKELYLLIESPESPGATRLAHDTLAPLVRVRFAESLAPALRGRRILEKRAVEWQNGKVGPVLDQADLAIVEQALDGMRTLTDDENRLLDASRAAEKRRQADEAESRRKSAQEEQARVEAERRANQATEQRLKDQEAFNQKLIRVLAGLAALAVIAIAAGSYAWWERGNARHLAGVAGRETLEAQNQKEKADAETLKAQEQEKIARDNAGLAEKGERRANQNLYAARVRLARSLIKDGEIRAAWELLDRSRTDTPPAASDSSAIAVVPPATEPGWEWYYLTGLCRPRLGVVPSPGNGVIPGVEGNPVVFHPNGRSYFTGDIDGTVVERDAQTCKVLRTVWSSGREESLGFGLRWHNGQLTVVSQTVLSAKRTEEPIPNPGDVVVALSDSTGRMVPVTERDAARFTELVHGPDGSRLELEVKPPGQGQVKHYSVTRRAYDRRGKPSAITALTISRDGTMLGIACGDNSFRVWELDGYLFPTLIDGGANAPDDQITSMSISPNGEQIALAAGFRVALYDTRRFSSRAEVCGNAADRHKAKVSHVAFVPHGDRVWLASAARDGTLKLWDVVNKTCLRTLDVNSMEKDASYRGMLHLAPSPDGKRIAVVSRGGELMCWSVADSGELKRLEQFSNRSRMFNHVAFCPSDDRLAASLIDGTVRLFDYQGVEVQQLAVHSSVVGDIAFSPDGRLIASTGYDRSVSVWRLAVPEQVERVIKQGALHVRLTPDARRLLTAGGDGTVCVWDSASGRLRRRHRELAPFFAFTSGGKRFVAVHGRTLVQIDLAAGDAEQFYDLPPGYNVHAVASNPEGNLIAVAITDADKPRIIVLDTAQKRVLTELTPESNALRWMVFSRDGTMLAHGSPQSGVEVWRWNDKKHAVVPTDGGQTCGVFRPATNDLVLGGMNGVVGFWSIDENNGELQTHPGRQLKGHRSIVLDIDFTRDGSRIVSGGADGTVRIWDAISGQELLALRHPDEVRTVAFGDHDWRVVSGSATEVKMWDAALLSPQATRDDPWFYLVRGCVRSNLGLWEQAVEDFSAAIERHIGDPYVWQYRGDARARLKNYSAALADLDKAVKLIPNDPLTLWNLASAQVTAGRMREARRSFEKAVEDNPESAAAHNNLAWLLATCWDDKIRDGKKAIELARKACELTKWENPTYLDTLAAAYAEAGQFDEAVKQQKEAVKALKDVPAELKQAQQRLGRYEKRQPYHEPRPAPSGPASPDRPASR